MQVCLSYPAPTLHVARANVLWLLQVYDMLCAAGLSQQDPLLASLFRVERVCDQGMDQFNQVVDLDPAHGASRELLAGMAARQRWEHAPQGYRAQRLSLRREKVMMGQLQLVRGTEFRRFPEDSSQLFVPPCLGEGGKQYFIPQFVCMMMACCSILSVCSSITLLHATHLPVLTYMQNAITDTTKVLCCIHQACVHTFTLSVYM